MPSSTSCRTFNSHGLYPAPYAVQLLRVATRKIFLSSLIY